MQLIKKFATQTLGKIKPRYISGFILHLLIIEETKKADSFCAVFAEAISIIAVWDYYPWECLIPNVDVIILFLLIHNIKFKSSVPYKLELVTLLHFPAK